MLNSWTIGVFAAVLALTKSSLALSSAAGLLIGTGKADITGPAAERGMMGYGLPEQKTKGILTRLFARAIVLQENASDAPPLVIVVADLAMISEAVSLAVIDRLRKDGLGIFDHGNTLLMATHTHSGPGGFFSHPLYNLTINGFDRNNFRLIVDGIVASIALAWSTRLPGKILYHHGKLHGASVNRSPSAFASNREFAAGQSPLDPEEQELKDEQSDRQMHVLRLVSAQGTELGMLNWFAVHLTSMSNHNHLISGDNKGVAAQLFEKWQAPSSPSFVAAFANGAEGDVSPNIFASQPELSDREKTTIIGTKQFAEAQQLYNEAQVEISPPIKSQKVWITMPGFMVRKAFTGDADHLLCPGALGYSFAAGADDGPSGVPGFYQGMKAGDPIPSLPMRFALGLVAPLVSNGPADDRCHAPKAILLSTNRPHIDLTASVLPFQLVTIGQLALVAVPAELTTMAGYRLRKLVAQELAPLAIERVIIAGLSNSYSGYVTTWEEYQQQRYEGGHTQFGPHTHSAYLQIFSALAKQRRGEAEPALATVPPPQSNPLYMKDLHIGVIYDASGSSSSFGQVLQQAESSYHPEQTAQVVFQGAHPNNSLLPGNKLLEIQRQNGLSWESIATDNDFASTWSWERQDSLACFGGCSLVTSTWTIPPATLPGTYRFVYYGHSKTPFTGKIVPFIGRSREFQVEP